MKRRREGSYSKDREQEGEENMGEEREKRKARQKG